VFLWWLDDILDDTHPVVLAGALLKQRDA